MGLSASNDGSPKFKHQKIETEKDPANEKRLNRPNKFEKEEIDDDWSDDVSVQKERERDVSIGPRRGGVPFKPLAASSGKSWDDGAEERLIKEKGLSPGSKKWYAHEKE
jgi:hypothetical protein